MNKNNRPKALTDGDITEIAEVKVVQEMWGAESSVEMAEIMKSSVYGAKFDYMTGSAPGYAGPLYILIGDTPDEPVRLIRLGGKLQIYA
ncbi:MAG TPA: hypothetical protein VMF32_04205 [Xanthobacteraceae bacterium]|nr:hypothetical protein [Xanthobacteraceae bacterium]